MNVFVPYQQPILCAQALWNDQKRFNKQIIECQQILDAIDGKKAWKNHPCTRMYKNYSEWLENYERCLFHFREFMKGNEDLYAAEYFSSAADSVRPPFLTEEFCDQHKRRLYTKAPLLYPMFEMYGTSEINWYFVNGEIVKYANGKRVKE